MVTARLIISLSKKWAAAFLCFIIVCVCLLPLAACAREAERKIVRVGWYESPFNRMDQFGRRSGYAYEYQEKIAAYTGWEYAYVEGSWPELFRMLQDGEIDLLSDVSYTPERAETMLFPSLAMGAEEYYIFVAPDDETIRQDDPRTLDGKKIGVNKGSVQAGLYREWAGQCGVQAELVELTGSDEASIQMVRAGDLDAFISLDAYGGRDSVIPVFRVGSSDFYFAVSKGRPDLLGELNTAMNRLQEENRYFTQQLSRKYMLTAGANLFLGADEKSWLEQRAGVIRVGYQDNFLAFCAKDKKTGELTGALRDYLEDASVCFSNAQIRYEAVAYPTADAAMDALKNREVDCMFPANLSTADGEARGFVLTPPVMSTDIYALVRKADSDTFRAKEQVTAAQAGTDPNAEAIMRDHFPGWRVDYYPDVLACLKAVDDGVADCVLISYYNYNGLAALCDQYDLIPLATGQSTDIYFAVNLGDNALYSILTRTTNLVSDTATNAALSYYSSESPAVSLDVFIRHNPVLVGAVLLAILALVVTVFVQYRLIAARKEVEKSHHQVEDLSKQVVVDALTHVRNKTGYEQWEQKINEAIRLGEQEPFAVVVCDINDLKTVNDQYGHKEGDVCIQNCSAKICSIFSHSPVFRIGGDEFVVFLSGEDYSRRKELLNQVNALPKDRSKIRAGETLSAGMAEYDREKHRSLLSVAEDADKAMYARKQYVKELVMKKDEKPDSETGSDYIPAIHARKRVLVVDDQEMNRDILGDLLEDEYELMYAADGVEALEVLRGHKDEIDLVLLDLIMPNKSGKEVLAEMQVDEDLMSVPVIVITSDQEAELDCLKIGAMDFIPKPYPDIEIVKARISKCIELSEDRELIRYTERDKLTGLLNRDYFYRYVSRLDHVYRGTVLDAVVCDVNRFHSVNKQYGRPFGTHVLRGISTGLKELARATGGICCREEDDTFLLYCPHQENYEQLIGEFLSGVLAGREFADKVSVRFGIFTDALRVESAEERFERAKIAADRVKADPEKICGFYDQQ